ncbi:MAG: aminopeptidase P family protein [Candidatus Aenigmarchaeota archaeon]|nr:aminopeptidase P family protein [Candidatus Aenigmarchaeota archaeon]
MRPHEKILENAAADAVLLSTYDVEDPSFFYATQLEGVFENSFAVLNLRSKKMSIIVPKLEEETASRSLKENKIKSDVLTYSSRKELEAHLQSTIKVRVLGLNYNKIPLKAFDMIKRLTTAKFSDISDEINRARSVKDKNEIDKIKKAAEIAQKALERTIPFIEPGVYEGDVAAKLEYEMRRLGAVLSFTTICAFGENSSQPHYVTGNNKLKKGNFILIDFGAKYKNYCSDITRTFVMGRMNGKQREMIETVNQAQEIGAENLIEGEQASKSHIEAQNFIDKKFKGKFIHTLGHSLGIEVHDGQRLYTNSSFVLENNMVFTIEPGVYIQKFGGVRIEDDFVVNGKKPIWLTKKQESFEL